MGLLGLGLMEHKFYSYDIIVYVYGRKIFCILEFFFFKNGFLFLFFKIMKMYKYVIYHPVIFVHDMPSQ
jgi:hypothetical protein